jgi:hypothetical protein
MALMEGEHIGPFNLGNPGEFTMLELAQVCFPFPFFCFHTKGRDQTFGVFFINILIYL